MKLIPKCIVRLGFLERLYDDLENFEPAKQNDKTDYECKQETHLALMRRFNAHQTPTWMNTVRIYYENSKLVAP